MDEGLYIFVIMIVNEELKDDGNAQSIIVWDDLRVHVSLVTPPNKHW